MLNKHKTPLTALADAQGELGVKVLSSFLQDTGPEWRWWMTLAVASKAGLAVGFGVTGGPDQHSASTLCTVTAAWR